MILPLTIERKGLVRRLVFLGRGLCDFNGPLLHPRFPDVVPVERFRRLWASTLREIARNCGHKPNLIVLDQMPARIGGQANPLIGLGSRPNPSASYVATFCGNWDEFYTTRRSSGSRRRDRQRLRKFAEHGSVELVTADGQGISETLEHLFTQKQRTFERMGVDDLFAKPGYRSFFLEVAQSAPELVHVSQLSIGGKCAAANLGLMFHDCYYYVLISYDDGPLSRYGPGAAHLHKLMEFAISKGLKHFDFTIGDEGYKLDWADTKVDLFDHVGGRGLIGRSLAGAAIVGLTLKRAIKQSPRAWRYYSTMRARLKGGRSSR